MTRETSTQQGRAPERDDYEDGFKSQKVLEEEILKLRAQVAEDFEEIKGLREHAEALESNLSYARQNLTELTRRAMEAESYEKVFRRQLHQTQLLLQAAQESARELRTSETGG